MKTKIILWHLLLAAVLLCAPNTQAGLFGPKGDNLDEKKANVHKQHDEMLADLYQRKPEMREILEQAAGYATFKHLNVNLLLVATANGYGVVKDNKTGKETFMRMASLGGGLGAGLKDVRVVFVFHDPALMKQFIDEGWQFGGQADAAAKYQDTGVTGEQNVKGNVSVKEGNMALGSSTDMGAGVTRTNSAGAKLATRGGMEIYQFTESGIALQATVAGTKYWKDSKLNQSTNP
jgi:lipid-binding SYLF domain-containing protein